MPPVGVGAEGGGDEPEDAGATETTDSGEQSSEEQ